MTHEARLLGRGRITDLAWTPDGRALGVAGSLGIWLYDATNLTRRRAWPCPTTIRCSTWPSARTEA